MNPEHGVPLDAIEDPRSATLWARFHSATPHARELAVQRLQALTVYQLSIANGLSKMQAVGATEHAMRKLGHKATAGHSLYRWRALLEGTPLADWLPVLLPAYVPGNAWATVPAEAWQEFLADYRAEGGGNATACYRRIAAKAGDRGWQLPSLRTFERWLKRWEED